jgi:hypothetical protein
MANDRIGIVANDSEEIIRDDPLERYEVYVVSPQLKEGLGIALIDSGFASVTNKRSIFSEI